MRAEMNFCIELRDNHVHHRLNHRSKTGILNENYFNHFLLKSFSLIWSWSMAISKELSLGANIKWKSWGISTSSRLDQEEEQGDGDWLKLCPWGRWNVVERTLTLDLKQTWVSVVLVLLPLSGLSTSLSLSFFWYEIMTPLSLIMSEETK